MEYSNLQGVLTTDAAKTIKKILQQEDRISVFLQLYQKVLSIIPSAIVRGKDDRVVGVSCPEERFIFYISVKDSENTIKFQGLQAEPFLPDNLSHYLILAEAQANDRTQNPTRYQISKKDKKTGKTEKASQEQNNSISPNKEITVTQEIIEQTAQTLFAGLDVPQSREVPLADCESFVDEIKSIVASIIENATSLYLRRQDRKIYKQRITTEETLDEIAGKFGCTKEQVAEICSRSKKAVLKEIKEKPSAFITEKTIDLSSLLAEQPDDVIFVYLRFLIIHKNYPLYLLLIELYFPGAEQKEIKDAINKAPRPARLEIASDKRSPETKESPITTLSEKSENSLTTSKIPSSTLTTSLAPMQDPPIEPEDSLTADISSEMPQFDSVGNIVFFDLEVGTESKRVSDIGAVKIDYRDKHKSQELRTASRTVLARFVSDSLFVCGHNIFAHDLKYVRDDIAAYGEHHVFIDTLPFSPLLFPEKPYHRLVKDDKLQAGELNNPLNDAKQAAKLFYDEVNAYNKLPQELNSIYCNLLYDKEEFAGFFSYVEQRPTGNLLETIQQYYAGKICENVDLTSLILAYPIELAYALALINTDDRYSIIPPWLLQNYPNINLVMEFLRNIPCREGCVYCKEHLNIHINLKRFFGFDEFRTYNDEPLQENAIQAAVNGCSLLAIFPTGGGKSLTFQLPALMAGESVRGLTVVISPLQSLMKDQVDNLEEKGIIDAVTINGLLNPIERADAVRRVEDGSACILYISPESLRSATVEKLLLARNVVRFVVDEAHCFSAWGQDFRPDYLYIGDFIRNLQEKKHLETPIPVSCFTATAKQKVISDIKEYFREKLNVELSLFSTDAARSNLRYEVLYRESEEEKYATLRNLIIAKNCPTIVYVSYRKKARELAARLSKDGLKALPYHGKMDSNEKIENQNAFKLGAPEGVDIIVATSAFGMGVDKSDVGMVVHYNMSSSLEDYVQEAGRAGRDPSLQAECYVLFNDLDLDEQFARLSQEKLSISEIKEIWKAVKDLSGKRGGFKRSALEIARHAGWGETDDPSETETRVKVALAALENAGYIKRGRNVPRVFADGILSRNMEEAADKIERSGIFEEKEKKLAKEIIRRLIGRKHRHENPEISDEADNRVDVIADSIGLSYFEISKILDKLRSLKVLADSQDMSAFIDQSETKTKSQNVLNRVAGLERYLVENLPESGFTSYKELNDAALRAGVKSATVAELRKVLAYWQGVNLISKKVAGPGQFVFTRQFDPEKIRKILERKLDVATFIIEYLFGKIGDDKFYTEVKFSTLELTEQFNDSATLFSLGNKATMGEIRAALLYLNKIGAMKLDGGFLVFYNALQVERVEMDNSIMYKKADYEKLHVYYEQKVQQIHIVRKYAQLMTKDYDEAQTFVHDYFQMDYMLFIRKYLKGEDIKRPITPETYNRLFGELTAKQREIIDDDSSQYIVVAAGPGSGKTKVLVHKLASLRLLEDVKEEQLLMLTFSRSAATEFKERLITLLGTPAYHLEIRTFHSYCFDLLGQLGTIEESQDVVKRATELIRQGEVDPVRITKTVLVIDEAQDMSEDSFGLVRELMDRNEDMRIIAVGDDDQAIFGFAKASSKYMVSLIKEHGATKYELVENFRSSRAIVDMANCFASTLKFRMKTQPISAVSHDPGSVQIINYETPNMESATKEVIQRTFHDGLCCVLTATNDSALRMAGLLNQSGYRAKLIQANDGFDLYDLAEIRVFIHLLDMTCNTLIIPQNTWEEAVDGLKKHFRSSSRLDDCVEFLQRYDKITPTKYRSDLLEYIHESRYEDLVSNSRGCVLVSTYHKSKGREFDHVYMILDQPFMDTEEKKRVLYVGMTRAKQSLYIGSNNHQLSSLNIPESVDIQEDHKTYPEAEEIVLQLSHRGVNLGFFSLRQDFVRKTRSGTSLFLEGEYLSFGDKKMKVVRLSKASYAKLNDYFKQGYEFKDSEVRYLVYWHQADQTEADDQLIILPTITLCKSNKAGDNSNSGSVS